MSRWLIIAGMGAVTYGIRLSMLVFVHHASLPPPARNALRYVSPAVLAAIIAPAVLYAGTNDDFSIGPGNERLLAALLAAGVAWVTKNVWLTIAVGMAALWVLSAG
jgi:branched-subunit amino acid transport protein